MLSVQLPLGTEVGEEFAAWDVLHEEEQVAGVLREALQANLCTKNSNLNYNVRENGPALVSSSAPDLNDWLERAVLVYQSTYQERVINVGEDCVLGDHVIDLTKFNDV